jgi:PAS domain S-box-containing protein
VGALPGRLRWYVGLVATAGVLAVAAVVLLEPGRPAEPSWPRLAALLALTAAAELLGVRVPHRGALEMVTLYEAMVVADIALLPPGQAVAVLVAGFLLAEALQRRTPAKLVFNLGMHGLALAPAVGLYHLVAGAAGPLGPRGLAAMAAAAALFVLLNLLLIGQLLALLEDRAAGEVVREAASLSLLVFLGNSAVGLMGVVCFLREPAALPAAVLPVMTVGLAARSAGRQARERERFERLFEVSRSLASSLLLEELLPDVLPKVARLLGATDAHLLLTQGAAGAARPSGAFHGPGGFRFGPAGEDDLAGLRLLGDSSEPVVGRPGRTPPGWHELAAVPLTAEGHHLGVLLLGNQQPAAGAGMRLGRQDLRLLEALASALAVTLSNATHVAQINAEKSTLEQILGLSSDGILLLDGEGRVQVWNQAMERITGVPAGEAVGTPYDRWLAGPGHDRRMVRLQDLLASTAPDSPRASCEVRVRTAEGLERWLRCNHSLLYEGEAWTTDVVIVHDVTRIRQAERAKADFVATVSHELRTPITPIKGYVELLQARGAGMSQQRRQDILGILAERAEHMSRLVEDLLLASRISASERAAVPGLRRELVDLVEAARRAATDWRRDARDRLELELPEEPVRVDADPLRLVQVLANLLSNAHKYSPADQPVRLRVWHAGEWASAAVIDRGRGIPREELERVFDQFHRVEDPMTMTTGGTGLGLYIARQLTRAMGGDIEAASSLGHGSTFTVRLPLHRATTHLDLEGEDAWAAGQEERDSGPAPRAERARSPDPLSRSS